MKTTIDFKDGHSETREDVMPNCYDGMVSLVDAACLVLGDEIPLELIECIIFEND